MYFLLNDYTPPFLVVSVITTWMDTCYYKGFIIAPEDLDSVADISALLNERESAAFPELKARYTDDGTIAIDFEGNTEILDPKKQDSYSTPERKTKSSAVIIYDEDYTVDDDVKILIEAIG